MIHKNNLKTFALLSAVVVLTLASCDPAKKYQKEEDQRVQDYLNANQNLAFELKPSGLYYLPVVEGTGIMPVTHDTAYVRYTGKFLNQTVFDSNVGTTDTLIRPVNEGWLIPGFDEGITYMRVGGKSTFLMPSRLAYGPTGYYDIGGYTPLIFDVELLKVKRGPGK